MGTRKQGKTLFTAILALVATTVVLQLWLLTVAMEALLRHRTQTLIPCAIGSTLLLLMNAGLLRYVFRFDREVEGSQE